MPRPRVGSTRFYQHIGAVRQTVALSHDKWTPAGREIVADGRTIGQMRTPDLAAMVCEVHNVFLAVTNILLIQQRKLGDLPTPKEETPDEQS